MTIKSDFHLIECQGHTSIANGKKKKDFPNFFIPALFYNPKVTLTYFLTADYLTVWRGWQKYQSAPKHWFEQELLDIKTYLEKKNLKKEDLFSIREKEIPLLYKMIIRLEVSPQTVNYLNEVLNFKKILYHFKIILVFFRKYIFR